MSDLCPICKGAGSIFTSSERGFEWWPCPCCHGAGVRVQYGPAEFQKASKKQWQKWYGFVEVRND